MDLPEPKDLSHTNAEREDLHWKAINIINVGLLLYSCLHKLFIPVFRNLNPHQYTRIDWFWLFFVVLGFALYKKSKIATVFISTFGIVFCGVKLGKLLFQVVILRVTPSWEFVSLFMTEGLTLLFLMYLVVRFNQGVRLMQFRNARAILGISVTAGLVAVFLPGLGFKHLTRLQSNPKIYDVGQQVRLTPDALRSARPADELIIRKNGFSPPIVVFIDVVRIQNHSGKFFNLNVHGLKNLENMNSWTFIKNIPVFKDQQVTMTDKDLRGMKVLKFTSDSWIDAGMFLAVHRSVSLHDEKVIHR